MQCNAVQEGSARRLEEAWERAGVWASLIGSATGGRASEREGERERRSYRGRIDR